MIGQQVTGEDGKPLAQFTKLSPSAYNPNDEEIRPKLQVQVRVKVNSRYNTRTIKVPGLDPLKHHGVIEALGKRNVTVKWFINAHAVRPTIADHPTRELFSLYKSEFNVRDEF